MAVWLSWCGKKNDFYEVKSIGRPVRMNRKGYPWGDWRQWIKDISKEQSIFSRQGAKTIMQQGLRRKALENPLENSLEMEV